MKRLNKNTLFLVLLGLFAAFLLANLCSVSFFRRGDPGTDSSVFRYTAYAVTNGQILYKDVFDHKGPLMCLINVIGLLLHPELGVWALEFLALFTAVCFLYKTVRLVCGHPLPSLIAVFFALSPLTTSLQGGNLVEEFALPLIAAALYIFTEYFTSGVTPPRWKILVCGFCGGCVLMLRPDMTVTWLVFPIFVLIREIRRKNARVLGKFIPLFVLGVGAAVLPFFLYFLWADGLWDFYNAYLYFNFAYKDSTGSSLGAIVNAMYTFATLPVLLAASVVIFRCISGNRSLFDLAYLIYLPLSLVLAGISGRTAGHYSMVLVPVLAYPMGCLMAGYRRELFCRAAVTGLVLSLLATSWVYPLARTGDYLLHGISHPQNQNTLEAAAFIQETTDEDDRILVFGNKDILYLRSGRLSASKYSYQYPLANISEDIRREFYEQIRQAPPVLAIVEKEHDKTQRFDDDCYAYLESNQFVEVLSNELYTVYRQAGQEGA